MNKLEDLFDFLFKVVKWGVMITFIAFSVIIYKSCESTNNHIESKKIQNIKDN